MRVLVYGWYGRGNSGDELMGRALRSMFEPKGIELCFVPQLTFADVMSSDAVIVGGGSILNAAPIADPEALDALLQGKRPVFYLGVGMETAIDPAHVQLLKVSRFTSTRSTTWPNWVPNVYPMPDLAYALGSAAPSDAPEHRSVLVVPNLEVVPRWTDPHWMHVAWERFKDELAQCMDELVEGGATLGFLLMCQNRVMDDAWPAHELVARMKRRSTTFSMERAADDAAAVLRTIAGHSLVITQRFHGIVLAQMAGVPCVAVGHHDKLRDVNPFDGTFVAYHGCNKAQLHEAIRRCSVRRPITVSRELYDRVADAVVRVIEDEKGVTCLAGS